MNTLLAFLSVLRILLQMHDCAAQRELEKLQGVWRFTGIHIEGVTFTPEDIDQMKKAEYTTLVIVGREFVRDIDAGMVRFQPWNHAVDFRITTWFYNGCQRRGLYELQGDRLRLTVTAVPSGVRPQEMAAQGWHWQYTYERDRTATKQQAADMLKRGRESRNKPPSPEDVPPPPPVQFSFR